MATEIWGEFKSDVAITITPVGEGRIEVYISGEKVFDRKQEGRIYPGLDRVRQFHALIREKLQGR